MLKPFSAGKLTTFLEACRVGWRVMRGETTERTTFKHLIAVAPIPIVVLRGSELVVERANAAALSAAGNRDVIGQSLLEAWPALKGQGCHRALCEVMATGIPHVREEALVGLDGPGMKDRGTRYWTYTCARLGSSNGDEQKVVVVFADVTAQVVARRSLEALAAEADAASSAKDQFVAMLSHELRNPLSPIVTALEIMRMKGLDTPEQALIERQVHHLVRLVDDLLDIARITRGKVGLNKRPIELREIVSSALEMVSPLLEEREHRVSVDVPLELGVEVDPDRMSQVVSNLLTNAARYSDRGSAISIAAKRHDGHVRLSVTDQGTGIDSERLEHIFDAFEQRGQTSDRPYGGLGLGLAIVRNFVRLHGGEVHAYSEGHGKGSELVVTLPWVRLVAEPGPEPVVSESLSIAAAASRSPGGRVLVIDDNRDAAQMLAAALTRMGYYVRVAYDGPSALSAAESFSPETALVDIGLPAMDGYELGKRLRERNGALRLIALTGYGQAQDRRRSAAAGFDAHLVKPVALDAIRAVLERFGTVPSMSTVANAQAQMEL